MVWWPLKNKRVQKTCKSCVRNSIPTLEFKLDNKELVNTDLAFLTLGKIVQEIFLFSKISD